VTAGLGQPPGLDIGRDAGVDGGRLQGLFDLSYGGLAQRLAGVRGELSGRAHQPGDQLAAPLLEAAEVVAGRPGVAQPFAHVEQPIHLFGRGPGQHIDRPGRHGRAAQLAQPLGQRRIVLGQLVPGRDEVGRGYAVQPGDGSVEVHIVIMGHRPWRHRRTAVPRRPLGRVGAGR
jgi:hypothetical protein